MSNIHGLGRVGDRKAKKDGKTEEFSQQGKTSGTAVYRPTGDVTADLVGRAKASAGAGGDAGAKDRSIGTITVYGNGFIIGNGAFRDKKDPKNARFITQMLSGHVPRELEDECRKEWGPDVASVALNLVDKTSETYTPPPPKFDFKTSSGTSLGSGSSAAVTAVSFSKATAQEFKLDEAGVKTTVQLVLHPRQRVRVQFNDTTTVLEVYQHVMFLSKLSGFSLKAGFPPKPLTNPAATLKDAKLLSSSIQQFVQR